MRVTRYGNEEASDELQGAMAALRALLIFSICNKEETSFASLFRSVEIFRDQFLEGLEGKVSQEFGLGCKWEMNKFLTKLNDCEHLARKLLVTKSHP